MEDNHVSNNICIFSRVILLVSKLPGCTGSSYTLAWGVWADFSQSGSFSKAANQIKSGLTTVEPLNLTATVAIPATTSGYVRVRVAAAESLTASTIDPCVSWTYGSLVDFLLFVSPAPTLFPTTHAPSVAGLTFAPSVPTKSPTAPTNQPTPVCLCVFVCACACVCVCVLCACCSDCHNKSVLFT